MLNTPTWSGLTESNAWDTESRRRRARAWPQLLSDIRTVTRELEADLQELTEEEGKLETLCEGWSVRDVIVHLAVGDDLTDRALQGENCFEVTTSDEDHLRDLGRANVDAVGDISTAESLTLFSDTNSRLLNRCSSFSDQDLQERVPWAAGTLSKFAALQARMMETWIHAWDIRHALGLTQVLDDRSWWVSDLGIRTLPYALQKNGLTLPQSGVRLHLSGAGGGTWERVLPGAESAGANSLLKIDAPTWAWLTLVSRRRLADNLGVEDLRVSPEDARHIVSEVSRAFA